MESESTELLLKIETLDFSSSAEASTKSCALMWGGMQCPNKKRRKEGRMVIFFLFTGNLQKKTIYILYSEQEGKHNKIKISFQRIKFEVHVSCANLKESLSLFVVKEEFNSAVKPRSSAPTARPKQPQSWSQTMACNLRWHRRTPMFRRLWRRDTGVWRSQWGSHFWMKLFPL